MIRSLGVLLRVENLFGASFVIVFLIPVIIDRCRSMCWLRGSMSIWRLDPRQITQVILLSDQVSLHSNTFRPY